jgi:transposase
MAPTLEVRDWSPASRSEYGRVPWACVGSAYSGRGIATVVTDHSVSVVPGECRESQQAGIRHRLDLIDDSTRAIDELSARIEEMMVPFLALQDLLVSIPGVSVAVADVIVAECGGEPTTTFATPEHLASQAGVCPGKNESAGRHKSTKTRPGNPYLKAALGRAALSAARSKGTHFAAKHRRIATGRGPMKALVALEHAMLIAAWNM